MNTQEILSLISQLKSLHREWFTKHEWDAIQAVLEALDSLTHYSEGL